MGSDAVAKFRKLLEQKGVCFDIGAPARRAADVLVLDRDSVWSNACRRLPRRAARAAHLVRRNRRGVGLAGVRAEMTRDDPRS